MLEEHIKEQLDILFSNMLSEEFKIRNSHALVRAPSISTIRINSDIGDLSTFSKLVDNLTRQVLLQDPNFRFTSKSEVAEVLCISTVGPNQVEPKERRVLVTADCGRAVLRGADVFAPGVVAIEKGINVTVSVWIDLECKCTKGFKERYNGMVKFVGNGELVQDRDKIFAGEIASGLGIKMTELQWRHPSFHSIDRSIYIPQNLPSIIAVKCLDVGAGMRVLDMCAAPGGKTTHLAAIMGNTGHITAIEKSSNRYANLLRVLKVAVAQNVECIRADSSSPQIVEDLGANSFDRVLLDPPCSGLGQRPAVIESDFRVPKTDFSSYQKKMLLNASRLLRVGGKLIYSTCTMNPEENEALVFYGLQLGLQLESLCIPYGSPGLPSCGLDEVQASKIIRFWPAGKDDTNAFFIAKFYRPDNSLLK